MCVYIKDALPTKRRWRVYIHKTIEPIKLSCAIVYNPAASRSFLLLFLFQLAPSDKTYSYFFFFRQRLVFVQCRRFLVSSDALHQHPPSAGRSVFLLLLLNRRRDKSLGCRVYTYSIVIPSHCVQAKVLISFPRIYTARKEQQQNRPFSRQRQPLGVP